MPSDESVENDVIRPLQQGKLKAVVQAGETRITPRMARQAQTDENGKVTYVIPEKAPRGRPRKDAVKSEPIKTAQLSTRPAQQETWEECADIIVPPGIPLPPRGLGQHGARMWCSIVQSGLALGTYTDANKFFFADCCDTYDRLLRAQRDFDATASNDETGTGNVVIEARTGSKQLNPLVGHINAMKRLYMDQIKELGISPLGLRKLGFEPKQAEDPEEEFFH